MDRDIEFHTLLLEASNNEIFAIMVEPLAELLRKSRTKTMKIDVQRAIAGHGNILKAVEDRDPEGAAKAMHWHLEMALEDFERRQGRMKMSKIIDLTLPIYHGAPTMPLDPKCAVIVHHTIESMKYNITQLIISTHHGTHLDAPYHFFNDGLTVDKLDLSKCVGDASVLDFTSVKPRQNLTPKDFKPYEKLIAKGARIILRTDWWKNFPKSKYFSDGPMISPELAQWLAKKEIAMIGLETPGVHPVQWEKVHKILLKAEIVVVEGLAYLNKLKKDKIFFIAAPLKIKGRDGSPVRAMAIENM